MTTINDSLRYIAYICPVCSEISEKYVNIFEFSSPSSVDFLCDYKNCGEECFSVIRTKDKFKITIECPACGDVHTFKISSQQFLLKELVTFSCPESNINIFFAGKKAKVKKALSDNSDMLFELTEQFDLFTEEMNLVYRIVDRLHYMIAQKEIVCSCCESTDVTPDMDNNGIALVCKNCKNHTSLNIDELTVDILENSERFEF